MSDHPLLLGPTELRRTVETPDGTVHWMEVGTGEPVMFIQAWGPQPGVTAWLIYRRVVELLGDRYRCILVDLPNYGLTGPVTYEEPVHDVAARAALAVLDALGIDRLPVIGASMGATTAIDLAIGSPERVSGILVGACHASTGGDPYLLGPFPSEAGRLYRELMGEPDSRDKLVRLMNALVFDPDLVTDDLVDELTALRAVSQDHLRAHQASVSVPHSNLAQLTKIGCPVKVVHGRFDRMVPYEQGLMIASYVRRADLVVLNRCGHWPPYERPEAFAREVADLVASVPVPVAAPA